MLLWTSSSSTFTLQDNNLNYNIYISSCSYHLKRENLEGTSLNRFAGSCSISIAYIQLCKVTGGLERPLFLEPWHSVTLWYTKMLFSDSELPPKIIHFLLTCTVKTVCYDYTLGCSIYRCYGNTVVLPWHLCCNHSTDLFVECHCSTHRWQPSVMMTPVE